jgi:hypothetical protein
MNAPYTPATEQEQAMQPRPWDQTNPSDEAFANVREWHSHLHPEYEDKFVAFSWDGKQVVASADTNEGLERAIDEAGLDPSRVIRSYVPNPDVSYM